MYRKILQQYWGYDDFRGIQREIIESIGSGKDTLGLMPTGGGKSITFQVPALAMEGVCIVVTPLIALMKDQVQHLRQRGIMATAIYSGMSRGEIITALENCILGDIKLLYVSPERLGTPIFKTKLAHMKVSFITVDEAHCISQWGYDFRPAYLTISDIRKLKPGTPVLALTATATPKVIDDIQDRLEFKEKNVFSMSFERKNISYVVRNTIDKEAELLHILNSVKGSAIVYTRSRSGTRDISKFLSANNIKSTFFHAGLENAVKDQRQQQWQQDETRVIVATNAFGMGIDKPDVRLVIHMDCPDSIEAYFQEAGRAGRDGRRSWAVLLYNPNDKRKLHSRVPATYPDKTFVRDVYERLAYYFQIAMGFGEYSTHTFDIDKFCLAYKMFPVHVDSALRILQNAGHIEYETEPESRARLRFLLQRSELYLLNNLTEKEELIITAMLRLYGGLFVDYVYISEAQIAIATGLDANVVYLILKSLSKRHIVHFIPQRKMPFITYVHDREEKDRISIPSNVYEDRKTQMEQRIDAMVKYAEDNSTCRSIQLLRYFGEETKHECGACDVCNDKAGHPKKDAVANAKDAIMALLSDKHHHKITELNDIRLPKSQMTEALRYLINEELVFTDGPTIFLK